MKKNKTLFMIGIIGLFALSAFAQEKNSFVGVAGCKMCHSSKKSGAAFKIWQKGKHAQAYAVLASDAAKAIAKEKGIADPQKADECLSCHVTGHGVDAARLGKKYKVEDGVGCESCHGAGSAYKSMKTMKDITAGKIKPESVGLIIPTEEVCVKCHNKKSPSFKPFDFKERAAKIAHPIPK